jgi:hypothetical protein
MSLKLDHHLMCLPRRYSPLGDSKFHVPKMVKINLVTGGLRAAGSKKLQGAFLVKSKSS